MCLPKRALSWMLNPSSTVPAFIEPPLQADVGDDRRPHLLSVVVFPLFSASGFLRQLLEVLWKPV